jgi:hypothetical protein
MDVNKTKSNTYTVSNLYSSLSGVKPSLMDSRGLFSTENAVFNRCW